jgi:hypothetical protein
MVRLKRVMVLSIILHEIKIRYERVLKNNSNKNKINKYKIKKHVTFV